MRPTPLLLLSLAGVCHAIDPSEARSTNPKDYDPGKLREELIRYL